MEAYQVVVLSVYSEQRMMHPSLFFSDAMVLPRASQGGSPSFLGILAPFLTSNNYRAKEALEIVTLVG
jgi:hypothetical protein